MYYVYVLKSVDHNFTYKGMTNDLKKRVAEYNSRRVKSTKRYAPLELIHFETFETRIEARSREKFLKSGSGREFIKNLFSCRGGGIGIRA